MTLIPVDLTLAHACQTCAFCQEIPNPQNLTAPGLTCLRYPPAVVNIAGGQYSVLFPTVMPDWRCGEYKEDEERATEQLRRRNRPTTARA